MPKISAILHSNHDEQRLARALDSLRPCDEVVVIDHAASDEIREIARQHGALVRLAVLGVKPGAYINDLQHDWVLCVRPNEALAESLEASLLEWKQAANGNAELDERNGFCVNVREETENGWKPLPAELRLVNRQRINFTEELPPPDASCLKLGGDLLRFNKP